MVVRKLQDSLSPGFVHNATRGCNKERKRENTEGWTRRSRGETQVLGLDLKSHRDPFAAYPPLGTPRSLTDRKKWSTWVGGGSRRQGPWDNATNRQRPIPMFGIQARVAGWKSGEKEEKSDVRETSSEIFSDQRRQTLSVSRFFLSKSQHERRFKNFPEHKKFSAKY